MKATNEPAVTFEEYFNSRVDLKNRDIGRTKEETIKIQTFHAQLSLCDEYPLSLQEQILPIIDLMAIRYVFEIFLFLDEKSRYYLIFH